MFDITLGLFLEQELKGGIVIGLDEAHKVPNLPILKFAS